MLRHTTQQYALGKWGNTCPPPSSHVPAYFWHNCHGKCYTTIHFCHLIGLLVVCACEKRSLCFSCAKGYDLG